MMRRLLCGVLMLAPATAKAGSLGLWKSGVESYSATGHLPATPAWDALKLRHDLDPGRFDAHHPRLEGLFTLPDCVGELPNTKFWANLEHRYGVNPARFTINHPFLGPIVARSIVADAICRPLGGGFCPPIMPPCTIVQPPCPPLPPVAIPAPSGMALGLIGITLLSIASRFGCFGGR